MELIWLVLALVVLDLAAFLFAVDTRPGLRHASRPGFRPASRAGSGDVSRSGSRPGFRLVPGSRGHGPSSG